MEMRANNLLVIKAQITENELAQWVATIDVDDEEELAQGAHVDIVVGDQTWSGTVRQGAFTESTFSALVIGGADKLETVLPAKFYYQVSAATIIADLARECGETFDAAASDPALSAYTVPCWHRAGGEARIALKAIVDEFGGIWRVTRAGKILVLKEDQYPDLDRDYTEVKRNPAEHAVIIESDDEVPFARPGISVGGERVVTAMTVWTANDSYQVLQIHDGTDRAQDPTFSATETARRANEIQTVYGRLYPSKVVQQDADGTLHLLPDDERMRGFGLTHVVIRNALPGMAVKATPGQYVDLGFEQGDPKRPYAALWQQSSTADQPLVRGKAFADALGTFLDGCGTLSNAVVIACDAGATASVGVLVGLKPAFVGIANAFSAWGGTPAVVPGAAVNGISVNSFASSACGALKAAMVEGNALSQKITSE